MGKELENDLIRVRQALRGIGEESYLSFSRLANASSQATQRIDKDIFRQIENIEQLVEALKENESAQEELLVKLREGIVTGQEYAETQTLLSSRQAELKAQITGVNQELEREIQLSFQSASLLEQKVGVLTRLKDAYIRLNGQKLFMESGKEGGFLNISSENGGLVSSTDLQGKLPDFDTILTMAQLAKSNPATLALWGGYEAITGAAKQGGVLSKWVDMVTTYLGARLDYLGKEGAALTTAVSNFFSGEWKAGWENLVYIAKSEWNGNENANKASEAVADLYELNKQVALHTELIKINNKQILAYCQSMDDANVSLEKRKKLLEEARRLEVDNYQTQAIDLGTEYQRIFWNKNKSVYNNIKNVLGEDLLKVENYFSTLNKGQSLSFDDQKELSASLNRITTNGNIFWDEETKSQFKTFFTRALEYNEAHRQNLKVINAAYQRGEAASKQAGQNTGQPADQNYRSSVYMPQAPAVGARVPVNGLSVSGASPSPSASDTDPAVPRFDPEPLRAELEEKKRFYQEDLAAYLDYLRKKMEADGQKDGPDGKQEQKIIGKEIAKTERTQENRLDGLLKQYQGYTAKMTSLTVSYQSEMALLEKAMNEAGTEEEKQRIGEAMDLRSDAYTASLTRLETENAGFSQILFGDLQNISKGALKKAIAEAKAFIKDWKANAGDISPETEQVMKKIEAGIEHATEKTKSDLPADLQEAAAGLRVCADLAYTFDESLGAVIETTAQVAQGAADIAGGIAMISTNPIQGAAGILSGITQIVGGIGKRLQENKRIREEYLQGLVETYSKELEYNSILRERLRIQQQLGETSLDYFGRMESELKKQQGDIDREYKEVWGKLMDEQYISGQGYKHGTWFRKAKTWNEYSSLAGKSYEEIESLYTQDKLEGSAKVLFERLRQLKEEGADVTEMMDQLHEQMKENWTGTTSSAIADSIVQGFLDGKRSAADFADSFQEMMRTAMMQAVKMKYLEGPLNDWYARFAEAAEGGLTEDKIATLRDEYNRIIEDAARQTENLEAITGVSMEGDAAMREAAAKGIASMSQETASELNGNFYALQYLTSNIDRNVTSIQSVLYQASDQWVGIEENTRYCRKLETMEKDMASIRKDMQDINNKGILMRTR